MLHFFHRFFRKTHSLTLKVTSPNGLHLRPVAKLVAKIREYDAHILLQAHGKSASGTGLNEILALGLNKDDWFTLTITAKEPIPIAKEIEECFLTLMRADEMMVDHSAKVREENPYTSRILEGVGLTDSIVCGELYRHQKVEGDGEVLHTFEVALERSLDELDGIISHDPSSLHADIATVHRELLGEIISQLAKPTLEGFETLIQEAKVTLINTPNASKIADYEDIRQRILTHMGHIKVVRYPDTPFVLLSSDLLPSQVAPLCESGAIGVILQHTSPTAHSAILLKNSQLTALIYGGELREDVHEVIIEGGLGIIVPNPSLEDKEICIKRAVEYRECAMAAHERRYEQALTRSQKTITILANISDLASAKHAKEMGASGVGLCRSEFIFTDHEPSFEEQVEAYGELFGEFEDFTIRTLDVGGDKGLSYVQLPHENNPFLGIRGIRLLHTHRSLIATQLHAILKAAANRPIKVMFPMIATPEEFIEAKGLALQIARQEDIPISRLQFGIMVELPSVLFALEAFDRVVDFYSVGTNDLTQYLFGIERTHPTLSVDPLSPILFEALRTIIAHTTKPVSLCGELAGDPRAVPRLIELGFTTLSISPALIPSIKESIRNV